MENFYIFLIQSSVLFKPDVADINITSSSSSSIGTTTLMGYGLLN